MLRTPAQKILQNKSVAFLAAASYLLRHIYSLTSRQSTREPAD
jgi:hypothetical protein